MKKTISYKKIQTNLLKKNKKRKKDNKVLRKLLNFIIEFCIFKGKLKKLKI